VFVELTTREAGMDGDRGESGPEAAKIGAAGTTLGAA
jgi:hypothetical protein